MHVDGVGPGAGLAFFDEYLVIACGNIHIDLIEFEAPGTTKNLSHGTPSYFGCVP
jgi:hypothetical protein